MWKDLVSYQKIRARRISILKEKYLQFNVARNSACVSLALVIQEKTK